MFGNFVGRGRFELPTSCLSSMRSKPTELTTPTLSSVSRRTEPAELMPQYKIKIQKKDCRTTIL